MTQITLPADVEHALVAAARQRGLPPEELAIDALRKLFRSDSEKESADQDSLLDDLSAYIGAVEGSTEAFSKNCGERFAEGLAEGQERKRS